MKDFVKLVRATEPRRVLAVGGGASVILVVLLRDVLHLRYAEEITFALTFLVGMVLGKIWIDDYRARTGRRHGPRTRGESPKAGEGGHQPQVRGHARTRARGRKAVRRHESR